jgi:transposase-like protein
MAQRKFLTPEQKGAIIREHLIDGVAVSDLCDKHGISPVLFYNWQRQLFENAPLVFERKTNSANAKRQKDAEQREVEQLRAKLQQKNEVIAELLQEHVQLKKANGEP